MVWINATTLTEFFFQIVTYGIYSFAGDIFYFIILLLAGLIGYARGIVGSVFTVLTIHTILVIMGGMGVIPISGLYATIGMPLIIVLSLTLIFLLRGLV